MSLCTIDGKSTVSGAKTTIIGTLMFSCALLIRSCWAELEYGKILAVGVGVLSYTFSKFKQSKSPMFLVLQLNINNLHNVIYNIYYTIYNIYNIYTIHYPVFWPQLVSIVLVVATHVSQTQPDLMAFIHMLRYLVRGFLWWCRTTQITFYIDRVWERDIHYQLFLKHTPPSESNFTSCTSVSTQIQYHWSRR